MSHTDVKDLKRRLSHFDGCFNEVIIIRVLSIISIHTAGLLSAAVCFLQSHHHLFPFMLLSRVPAGN